MCIEEWLENLLIHILQLPRLRNIQIKTKRKEKNTIAKLNLYTQIQNAIVIAPKQPKFQ